jgi:hypothetical protein
MKEKILVGMPCYGNVHPLFMNSVINFVEYSLVNGTLVSRFFRRSDAIVGRARDAIAAAFLDTDCEHLLMLDSDLEFNADDMHRMCLREEGIVGGMYFFKMLEDKPRWVGERTRNGEMRDDDKMVQVDAIGTGMLRIRRHVLEDMRGKLDLPIYTPPAFSGDAVKPRHQFFPTPVEWDEASGCSRHISEDISFCRLARKAGHKIWVDLRNVAKHYGEVAYPVTIEEKEDDHA